MAEEASSSKMAASSPNPVTWEEIELSESYLVSAMFEEAASLATSILTRIHENKHINSDNEIELLDMMEAAAMVLVQSWRESGRTSGLLNELEVYFGSMTAIPVQVVLIGACVQVSGGHCSGVRFFIEEYLSKWTFDNGKYCTNPAPDALNTCLGEYDKHGTLEADQYVEVVEFYTLSLLSGALNDVDNAVLWVEKAQLPEEARQDLLRRLLSLSSMKSTSSIQGSVSSPVVEEPESRPLAVKEVKQSDKPKLVFSTQCNDGIDNSKHSIWGHLQNIAKRSRGTVVASYGKIFFGCLIFLVFYYFRKKRGAIIRAVRRRALSLKQALVDIWQLAFSYQVNPLAAVQPLPLPTNRSR